jgi:hypothetical protein
MKRKTWVSFIAVSSLVLSTTLIAFNATEPELSPHDALNKTN